ncbi:helix-turn-helix domain-containing protein [Stappia sp.]|uniref:MerR family transcriptional regulator n=1 Tax=Stappia sp. TaxID=1870903 RepID=UPI0032D8E3D5
MLSIGALSRATGVKVPTIRYYEQQGLIDPPARSNGNQRRYPPQARDRLSFIRHARDLGLPLDAIRELLSLSENPEMPCADAHRIAATHLAEIRARIARLRRLESELKRITSTCDADTVGDCYVLQSFADHSLCDKEH